MSVPLSRMIAAIFRLITRFILLLFFLTFFSCNIQYWNNIEIKKNTFLPLFFINFTCLINKKEKMKFLIWIYIA